MWEFFRSLFEYCDHEWVREKELKFLNYEEPEDGEDEEIVSQQEYSLVRCKHCKATKYDKHTLEK